MERRWLPCTLALTAIAVVVAGSLLLYEDAGSPLPVATDYAPVRPYAGIAVTTQVWQSGQHAVLGRVDENGPAAHEGFIAGADVITAIEGQQVSTAADVYAAIERARPGERIDITVERFLPKEGSDTRLTEHDGVPLTFSVDLVPEPPPSEEPIAGIHTGVNYEDQLRIGMFLAPITKQAADHFGIRDPRGVLVRGPLPLRSYYSDLKPGDVLVRFDGTRVSSMADLQSLIDAAHEDKPIRMEFRRGNESVKITLDALGPNVPGANLVPGPARKRLAAGLASGGLHPSRLEFPVVHDYPRRDPQPGQRASSTGAIISLSDSAITIEVYSTGNDWTLTLTPRTLWLPSSTPEIPLVVSVGDFVQLRTEDGQTAHSVIDLSRPLPAN